MDNRLTFDEHLANVSNEKSKIIGLLRKLQDILPSPVLLTIYKFFIRPHIDYSDIISDQAYKFPSKIRMHLIQSYFSLNQES